MASDSDSDTTLHGWDIAAIVLYFILVIGVSMYAMYSSKRGSVSGYFLAGRFITFLPVGASLFASNIGSEHFIGLAGSGAAAGIGVGSFELNAIVLLQLLGLLFVPVYVASGVCTLPQFMERRFGGRRIRLYLSTLSLVLYIFTKISVNLYSGALFFKLSLNWSLYSSVLLILLLTTVCTITAGLTAVIYTDTLQTVVMVIGASILAVKSLAEVGGWEGLHSRYMAAVPNVTLTNTTCGYPREDSFTMLRGAVDSDTPWPGFLFGQTPASIWYWCADQMMVQRVLAAKSLSHAQASTIFAGYLKILPVFLMVIPGMVARVLYTDTVGCATPATCLAYCGSEVSCSNHAYPQLVLSLMPTGLKGVMIAVMLAALMSDLTSIFNSASTLFTMDMWTMIRKDAKTKELLLVGRGFVLVMAVISVLWIPLIEVLQGGQLYLYIQSIAAYLSPPIAAVYILAVISTRVNETGSFYGLVSGTVLGILRMLLEFSYTSPSCGQVDNRPWFVTLHYMYFAMAVFWLTISVCIVLSLLTPPPTEEQIKDTTIWTLSKDNGINNIELENKSTAHAYPTPPQEDQDIPTEDIVSSVKLPVHVKVFNWVCGFHDVEEYDPAPLVNSLKQSKRSKLLIYVNAGLVATVGLLLFIFFTVDPVSDIE